MTDRARDTTEAVSELVAWAFDHNHADRIVAETLPELKPSIRVLERLSFRQVGQCAEESVLRFQLPRSDFNAS